MKWAFELDPRVSTRQQTLEVNLSTSNRWSQLAGPQNDRVQALKTSSNMPWLDFHPFVIANPNG